MPELYSNNASTILASDYTAGSGVLNVTSTAGNFPSSANFRLSIYSSAPVLRVILKVTAITDATHFAVTAEGADANAFTGDVALLNLTAEAMDEIRKDLIQIGTDGSLPATTNQKTGNLYFDTDRQIVYRYNGSAWVAIPTGSLVLLEQHTASSSASLSFTSSITSVFDEYQIEIVKLVPATNNVDLFLRFSTNGGSSYDSSALYDSAFMSTWINSSFAGGTSGATAISIGQVSNDVHYPISATIKLFDPLSAAAYKRIVMENTNFNISVSSIIRTSTGAWYKNTAAVNAFQFLLSSGNISSGVIRCYGISK